MVAQKFGSSDPDVKAKGSKEKTDKPMQPASARVATTGQIGGTSNEVVNKSSARKSGKTMSFKGGGMVQGGFRNAGMEHKR